MSKDIIDLAEWRTELKLDNYKREEANLVVLAYLLKTNLYLMGEASGVKRNADIKAQLLHELELIHVMVQGMNVGVFN